MEKFVRLLKQDKREWLKQKLDLGPTVDHRVKGHEWLPFLVFNSLVFVGVSSCVCGKPYNKKNKISFPCLTEFLGVFKKMDFIFKDVDFYTGFQKREIRNSS